MDIYYLLIEAIPCESNDERKEFGGAYINCWIKEKNEKNAIEKANEYISSEGWEVVSTKESFFTDRDRYVDEPESLQGYDLACEEGIGVIFYTWPLEEEM